MGATYLVYIGLRILFDRAPEGDSNIVAIAQSLPPKSLFNVFVGGFWTNVLNPKVALFFLAFLPQFIRADAEGKSTAFLLLGILFNLSSVPINIGWAIAAAWMAKRESVQRGMYWLDKTAGCIFICFGIRLVLTERPTP
ncbi:LysE family translocator [Variovorax ginsengisoli]|uniref:LysE family translocator n=1 Tax=Variovorax ginsengisoli TaxID=363844 RepID=A0ABT8SC70_9BURK|nr:LysE family translocator [Variovorax ginsengisoli]MDN8617348.1 LysE family translocator [Variovorax ginsengisoli]MDO1536518.1 LysE family translocator [Variovorax ginsengisoli]